MKGPYPRLLLKVEKERKPRKIAGPSYINRTKRKYMTLKACGGLIFLEPEPAPYAPITRARIDALWFIYLLNVLVLKGDIIDSHMTRIETALEVLDLPRYMNEEAFKELNPIEVSELVGALDSPIYKAAYKQLVGVEKEYALELLKARSYAPEAAASTMPPQRAWDAPAARAVPLELDAKARIQIAHREYEAALGKELSVLRSSHRIQERYPDDYFNVSNWIERRRAILTWLELQF